MVDTQAKNRRRTEKRQQQVAQFTVFVKRLGQGERDHLRSHVFYSGAGDDYIATTADMLALAIVELLAVRGGKKVTVSFKPRHQAFVVKSLNERIP